MVENDMNKFLALRADTEAKLAVKQATLAKVEAWEETGKIVKEKLTGQQAKVQAARKAFLDGEISENVLDAELKALEDFKKEHAASIEKANIFEDQKRALIFDVNTLRADLRSLERRLWIMIFETLKEDLHKKIRGDVERLFVAYSKGSMGSHALIYHDILNGIFDKYQFGPIHEKSVEIQTDLEEKFLQRPHARERAGR